MAAETTEGRLIIEPLGEQHDRAAFSCGVAALDSYLQKQATQDARRRVAVPFVATPDGKAIAGYYTLSQFAVQLDEVPPEIAKRLPKYPMVPATLLGRLAVKSAFRGQGTGRMLLVDALYRSLRLSRQVASAGVIVDAKNDEAAGFYQKYGFLPLPRVRGRLFLSMATVEKLFP